MLHNFLFWLKRYDIFTGEQVGSLQGHLDKVNCCVFHPSSTELYSGANDNLVCF